MSTPTQSAIARLVEHHGGAAALSRKLDGRPPYQRIQEWLSRGWASPKYLFALKPLLPRGMKLEDLDADRLRSTEKEGA